MSENTEPGYGQTAPVPYMETTPRPRPTEDVLRGAIFASIVIPLGVLAWMIIWNFGFVASLVAWVVAFGAARMYGHGAGHPTRRGVWVVLGIVLVTMTLAFVGGMWLDMINQFGMSPVQALTDGEMWDVFGTNLIDNPELWESYSKDILMAALFSALGCFFTLRKLFASTSAATA
ncbi:hypothetical protein [Arthrobacter sp. 35W]|uniref:hypothetical protein n=1 Tax=Arthrobacter sp. 35W TaxID=1132441 RepID=UPI00041933CF|nr:hypothetical protein [Arthrobacter sp. 35W]